MACWVGMFVVSTGRPSCSSRDVLTHQAGSCFRGTWLVSVVLLLRWHR